MALLPTKDPSLREATPKTLGTVTLDDVEAVLCCDCTA